MKKHWQDTLNIRLSPVSLHIRPVLMQGIEMARMPSNIQGNLLKAMALYENSNQYSSPPIINVYKQNRWTFYASENMLNSSPMSSKNNLLFIDSGQFLYRIKIQGGFKSDIPHFLNSLVIEGKQLSFDYDENDKLINIGLK